MSKLAHSNQETMDEIERRELIESGNEDLIVAGSPCLNEPLRSQEAVLFQRRVKRLEKAVHESRRDWRTLYGRFWQLRHENSVRMPSWRVEMESKAWKSMRSEVRRYGELRSQLRALRSQYLPVYRTAPMPTLSGKPWE